MGGWKEGKGEFRMCCMSPAHHVPSVTVPARLAAMQSTVSQMAAV